jgi:hypothetical protein
LNEYLTALKQSANNPSILHECDSLTCIAFLSGVVGVSQDKHLGEYRLGEILFGNVFKLNLGRWEKAFCPKI